MAREAARRSLEYLHLLNQPCHTTHNKVSDQTIFRRRLGVLVLALLHLFVVRVNLGVCSSMICPSYSVFNVFSVHSNNAEPLSDLVAEARTHATSRMLEGAWRRLVQSCPVEAKHPIITVYSGFGHTISCQRQVSNLAALSLAPTGRDACRPGASPP